MRRLICAAAVVLLVGCAAAPSVPTHSLTQRTALPDHGGTFSVNDSGNYSRSGCGPFGPGGFSFSGSGVGTFIHRDRESGSLTSARNSCKFSGTATMVSKERPGNSITMALSSNALPCFRGPVTVTFIIVGGTGRFAQATGNGTVVFHCGNGNTGTYRDVWSGMISF